MEAPRGVAYASAPAVQLAAQPVASQAAAPVVNDPNVIVIRSPMVGTYYASPAPDQPAYIKVGQSLKEGDVVCIIEAMKLMNEIQAETMGEVVKIYVENAQPVEYGQPLFGIRK